MTSKDPLPKKKGDKERDRKGDKKGFVPEQTSWTQTTLGPDHRKITCTPGLDIIDRKPIPPGWKGTGPNGEKDLSIEKEKPKSPKRGVYNKRKK